ncbi:putative oxidoreductase [Colletotrichum siamense]|uniref:Oxidoreductase n=1 Tax=Colletotrichum siamense TaxID=690259 RepID=A0A9P5EZZ4_COLSI|nr:putative oxidoreductase [Colletotrichum siamense]KAF4863351.1 putative oxidoreductase [Colletotrichum siamense]
MAVSDSIVAGVISALLDLQVGRGIRRSVVSRDEIFITTKLWCNSHHPDDVEPALDDSLRDLGVDYLDLRLMQYPFASKRGPDLRPMGPDGRILPDSTDFVDTWQAIEKLLPTGKVKAIVVSNFSQLESERILKECSVIALAWGVMDGHCVIPKSTIEWQIKENLEAESIPLDEEDLQHTAKTDQQARFSDATELLGYKLYVGFDGVAS